MSTLRRLSPYIALLLILTLFVVFQVLETDSVEDVPSADVDDRGEVEVFFSMPDRASTLRGGPDAALAAAIEGAQFTVDMAIYKLDLWSIRDALLAARRRGVTVRLVVESDYVDEPEIQALVEAGIDVHEDRLDSLMHHKFTVIDGFEVWTGSMNYSVNGAYRHDNNLIRLRSSQVGANFTREFEEMFLDERYSVLSRADTPFPESQLAGSLVQVYFSPDDGVAAHLVDLIAEAEASVDVLAFALTSDPIGEALIEAHRRGIPVRVVVERDQAGNTGSEVDALQAAGVALRLDSNPNSMHHKVIVLDGDTVVTGSYNFSRSAEAFNDENLVVLHNHEIAVKYLVEFNRIYDRAEAHSAGRDE